MRRVRDVMHVMACGYGHAAAEHFEILQQEEFKRRRKSFDQIIDALFDNTEEDRPEMVAVGVYYDDDESRPFTNTLTFEEQKTRVYDVVSKWNGQINFKGDFYGYLNESYDHRDCQAQIMTRQDYDKWKAEQEFKKHERTAQAFAAECGKRLGTMEFLAALDEAVNGVRRRREQWNSGEVRAEEWAAHRFAGGGSESYYDDLNYVNSQFSSQRRALEGVYDYLRQTCPLLMCQYEEQKLANQVAEVE